MSSSGCPGAPAELGRCSLSRARLPTSPPLSPWLRSLSLAPSLPVAGASRFGTHPGAPTTVPSPFAYAAGSAGRVRPCQAGSLQSPSPASVAALTWGVGLATLTARLASAWPQRAHSRRRRAPLRLCADGSSRWHSPLDPPSTCCSDSCNRHSCPGWAGYRFLTTNVCRRGSRRHGATDWGTNHERGSGTGFE